MDRINFTCSFKRALVWPKHQLHKSKFLFAGKIVEEKDAH